MSGRRDRLIPLFSTSAIDLLACGLGAVLVLWVLTLGAPKATDEGESQAGFGEVRLRQFGVWHFDTLRITSNDFSIDRIDTAEQDRFIRGRGTSDPYIDLIAQRNSESRKYELRASSGNGRLAIETRTSNDSEKFAGEVTVRLAAVTTKVTMNIAFEICEQGDQTHYIEVRRIDFRRPTITRYVFHCERDARSTFAAPPRDSAPTWQKAFVESLRQHVSLWQPSPVEYLIYADCGARQSIDITYNRNGTLNVGVRPNNNASDVVDGEKTTRRLAKWVGAPEAITGNR